MTAQAQVAIKAAMSVARDVAEGRVSPAQLEAAVVEECRAIIGTVAGPDDPLWPLQLDVARQVLASGGVPADELAEWLAVMRAAQGPEPVVVAAGWIEQLLERLAEDDDEPPEDLESAPGLVSQN